MNRVGWWVKTFVLTLAVGILSIIYVVVNLADSNHSVSLLPWLIMACGVLVILVSVYMAATILATYLNDMWRSIKRLENLEGGEKG